MESKNIKRKSCTFLVQELSLSKKSWHCCDQNFLHMRRLSKQSFFSCFVIKTCFHASFLSTFKLNCPKQCIQSQIEALNILLWISTNLLVMVQQSTLQLPQHSNFLITALRRTQRWVCFDTKHWVSIISIANNLYFIHCFLEFCIETYTLSSASSSMSIKSNIRLWFSLQPAKPINCLTLLIFLRSYWNLTLAHAQFEVREWN